MNNKILGLSVLVALIGALTFLTPLYGTLLSNENNIVYARERQQLQTRAAVYLLVRPPAVDVADALPPLATSTHSTIRTTTTSRTIAACCTLQRMRLQHYCLDLSDLPKYYFS